MTDRRWRRRRYLATLVGFSAVGLAGCADDPAVTDAPDDQADGGGGGDGQVDDDGTGDDTGGGDGDAETDPGTATAADEGGTLEEDTASTGTDATPAGTDADLDLREANVVGVEVEPSGDAYRFDVTLYHDDDGEDGYANWWQVESLDGEQLGRRELLHAHSTDPFTRSETIDVPDGTACVVVRGHDQTHEYGGQAMTVDVENGESAVVRQGADRAPVSEDDCP